VSLERIDNPATAPPPLGPGDEVAVVAPSGPFDVGAFERGVARLRERYRVHLDAGITDRKGYLAGDDRRRLRELTGALENTSIKAIVAARGGYGATRLLDRLEPESIARHAKLLVGFSDVTALHAAWARAGVRSVHGPMVAALGKCETPLWERWIAMVEGAVPEPLTCLTAVAEGRARGPLVGGNLSVLAALCGTGYGPPLGGRVLFLEDTGEKPYRIDRMLTTLRQSGWLTAVSAVVLGVFNETPVGEDGVTVQETLAERLGDLPIPVLGGLPCGHVADNLELPLGAEVTVDAGQGTLEFHEPAAAP
jgi:muramoyltetrapeptide carboxypeptidase